MYLLHFSGGGFWPAGDDNAPDTSEAVAGHWEAFDQEREGCDHSAKLVESPGIYGAWGLLLLIDQIGDRWQILIAERGDWLVLQRWLVPLCPVYAAQTVEQVVNRACDARKLGTRKLTATDLARAQAAAEREANHKQ